MKFCPWRPYCLIRSLQCTAKDITWYTARYVTNYTPEYTACCTIRDTIRCLHITLHITWYNTVHTHHTSQCMTYYNAHTLHCMIQCTVHDMIQRTHITMRNAWHRTLHDTLHLTLPDPMRSMQRFISQKKKILVSKTEQNCTFEWVSGRLFNLLFMHLPSAHKVCEASMTCWLRRHVCVVNFYADFFCTDSCRQDEVRMHSWFRVWSFFRNFPHSPAFRTRSIQCVDDMLPATSSSESQGREQKGRYLKTEQDKERPPASPIVIEDR